MREIEFRGKDLDGVWRHGSLVNNVFFYADTKKGVPYIFDVQDEDYSCLADLEDGDGFYEMRKETIGQFTGLHDKNGMKIYEGDIIRTPLGRFVEVRYGRKEHIVRRTRPAVTYSFMAYGWIFVDVRNECNNDFLDDEICGGEIVGNIFDNQDLCK